MNSTMTPLRFFFLLLLTGTSTGAMADSGADLLLQDVYSQGGHTLYCQSPFNVGDRGVRVDSIYGGHLLLRHFNCITARQCSNKEDYNLVANDLHHLYPIQRSVEIDRRGSQFGDLPPDARVSDCDYRTSFQTFDPPDHAKGNVARAMLYMHIQHKLPLVGTLEMYQRWNRLDPPDDAERARNQAIARIQGNRNPYIDNPDLVDRLGGLNR